MYTIHIIKWVYNVYYTMYSIHCILICIYIYIYVYGIAYVSHVSIVVVYVLHNTNNPPSMLNTYRVYIYLYTCSMLKYVEVYL